MIRVRYILVLMILFSTLLFSGCTDKLGVVDLSGDVDLTPSNAGWAYRSLVETNFRRSNLSPNTRLSEFCNRLELNQTVKIGANEYYVFTRFSPGFKLFDRYIRNWPKEGFYTSVYDFETHDVMDPVTTKHSEWGDFWFNSLDEGFYRAKAKNSNLSREGCHELFFNEPSTGYDCVISSCYKLQSQAERKVDNQGNWVILNGMHEYKDIYVEGSAEIKIGFRQCLTGKKVILDNEIEFYVLDWNLDGRFTEKDKVWCSYINKYLSFGQIIRLTDSFSSSKDNKYRLSLEHPSGDGESNRLLIELVAEGKQ